MRITPEQLTAMWLDAVGTKCKVPHDDLRRFCEFISFTCRLYEKKPSRGTDTKKKRIADVQAYIEGLRVAQSVLLPSWAFLEEPKRPGGHVFESVERMTEPGDECVELSLSIQLEIERRMFIAYTLLEALEEGPDAVYNESYFLNHSIRESVKKFRYWGATAIQARALVEQVFIACKLPVPSSERAIRRNEKAAKNPDWPVIVQAHELTKQKLKTEPYKRAFSRQNDLIIWRCALKTEPLKQSEENEEGDSE